MVKLIVTQEEKEYLESLVDCEERKTSYGTDKREFLVKLQKKLGDKPLIIRPPCKNLVLIDEGFWNHYYDCSLGLDHAQYGSCHNCNKYEPIPFQEKVNFT